MSQTKGYGVFIDPINQKVSLLPFKVSEDYYINVNDITDALNCDTDWISEAEADWEELWKPVMFKGCLDHMLELNLTRWALLRLVSCQTRS